MMSVRAKFVLNRIEISRYGQEEMRTFLFSPVFGKNGKPDHENSKFWKASPSGELKLGTVNPEVWPQFELGQEYYLDFTPAPVEE
jgi:hypothetical protein